MSTSSPFSARLASLDILRGFDLFLLVFFQPVFVALGQRLNLPWLNWLKIYGMNSITAYMLGEVVNFRCVAASVSYGLERYLGDYYPVWLSFVNYLIVFLILRMMYKHRIFLKI